jgi:hypothetical protein
MATLFLIDGEIYSSHPTCSGGGGVETRARFLLFYSWKFNNNHSSNHQFEPRIY